MSIFDMFSTAKFMYMNINILPIYKLHKDNDSIQVFFSVDFFFVPNTLPGTH